MFEISGAVPPAHFIGGYAGAVSERQPPMYFRLGGGTLKGVSKPGEIVWSRVFVDDGELKVDLGRAKVVELPAEETERRWQSDDAAVADHARGHLRRHARPDDGRHKANHIQVAYAPGCRRRRSRAGGQGGDAFREMGTGSLRLRHSNGSEHGLILAVRASRLHCTDHPPRSEYHCE